MRRPAYCTAKADDEPCLASDVVMRFADGALAKLERVAIERRLDECEVCRRFVAEVLRQEREDDGGATASSAHGAAPSSSAHGASTIPDAGNSARVAAAAARQQEEARALALRLPVPGQRVDRYVIERPLGAGGMGMVSLALDEELKRHVVIKLVRPDLISADRPAQGETLEARLIREAQALARLSHPCVVSIFDIGRYQGQVFFAMEFVEGVDLASYLAKQRREPLDILAKFRQAGVGLGAAHRAGVVHRDFKPANVLVGDNGVVKVADFGLARGVATPSSQQAITMDGRAAAPAKGRRSSLLDAALTHVDRTVGTPAYMAPEQIAGEGVDARSDQFAFAVALIDALLHQLPSQRAVHPQTASRAELVQIDQALAAVGSPPPQRAALLRALSEEPNARFATMDELLVQLSDVTPMPVPMQPPSRHPSASGSNPAYTPPPPVPVLAPVAPASSSSSRRRIVPALAAVAALGGIALAGWAVQRRGDSGSDGSDGDRNGGASSSACASREKAIADQLAPAAQQKLLDEIYARPAAQQASPFERWTAETALGELEQRVAQLAAAQRARCEAPPAANAANAAPVCTLTTAAELTDRLRALGAVDQDPISAIAGAASSIEACTPPPPSSLDASAAARLQIAEAAVLAGDLQGGRAAATELATQLSTSAPLSAAQAWRAAAIAALLAGGKEAGPAIARCASDAERAGDDGMRAEAIRLQLETALTQQDSARVEQLGDLLRSLVARRGNAPRDLAQLEALLAEAHDRLGRYGVTVEEWARVGKLAEQAHLSALRARAALGELWARSRATAPATGTPAALSAADHKTLLQLVSSDYANPNPAAPRLGVSLDTLDALIAAAALELNVPVNPLQLQAVATAISPGRVATAVAARLRAQDARGDTITLRGWFETVIATAEEKKRAREAVELALEQARLTVAAAVKSADNTADSAPNQQANDALKRTNQLLYRFEWSEQYGKQPNDLSLRFALLQSEMVEAGLLAPDDVSIYGTMYQSLPDDSLLRAEAAWRVALLGRRKSRYLQGEEDLEKAIPLWRKLGMGERAATAAWWISGDSHPSSKRAHQFAELALELYREQRDAAHIAEVEAWLVANVRPPDR